ncbi:MAG: MBL fold metallo-hydrolase [Saprospiraceae bacterium]|nr:MBL fold metallo-hydrolase [Saprospiraceae bacterium]
MKLTSVEAGRFMLDGGAMFGVVPKRLWNKLNPADADNMCSWTMRSLLIETNGRKILVDCGIGFKQGEKFRSHFYPHGTELDTSLEQVGVRPEEITDVFITHFHFDHVGGALMLDTAGKITPTFPNAIYWSNEVHYKYASDPNARERASFLKENFLPLQEQGYLRFIDNQADDVEWMPGIKVRFVHGHTAAQMLLLIESAETTTVFCADLIPSAWHIPLPYIMAYDMQPMLTLEEKERLLHEAISENWTLFFEHDPVTEQGYVELDQRGKYQLKK